MPLTEQLYRRLNRCILLWLSLWLVVYPTLLLAQTDDCTYPEGSPTVANARLSFRSANLECATKELKELLAIEESSIKAKADAHLLIASVYFIEESNDITRRAKVKQELVELFLVYRNWNGQLEIRSSEFRKILSKARELAEWRYKNSPEYQQDYQIQRLLLDSTKQISTKENRWYTKWWAIGSGVGVIAMAAMLMTGSNTHIDQLPMDSLPPFPDGP